MANDNTVDAEIINAAIIDTNMIESNAKEVNVIKVNIAQNDTLILSAADTAMLEGVGNQDPATGGKAVYEARALLHKKIIDRSAANNLRTIKDSGKGKSTDDSRWQVFPNPANNSLTIKISEANEYIALIKLYDVTGREILLKQLNGKKAFYKLDLSILVPGSYRIVAKTTGNIQFSKQIVVVR